MGHALGLLADDRGHDGLARAPKVVILGQPRLPGPVPLAGPAVAARADGHQETVAGVPGAVQAAVGAPGPVVLGGPGLPGPVGAARGGHAGHRAGRLTWHGPGGHWVLAGQATEAATARDARATGDGALAGRNPGTAGHRALTRRDRAAAGHRAL